MITTSLYACTVYSVKLLGKVQLTVIIVAGIRESKFCYSVDKLLYLNLAFAFWV